jgi:hypothetical protein
MSYVAEELVISTSDLSITDLRTQLRAATESSLAAIRCLFNGLPKALFSPRQGAVLAGGGRQPLLVAAPTTARLLCGAGARPRWRLPAASLPDPALLTHLPPHLPHLLPALRRTDIKAEDVVLSELLNKRGPAAWLAACDADADSSAQLTRLAADCITAGTVLVLSSQSSFDLVLVPRDACTQDGVAFAAFATRVRGGGGLRARVALPRRCRGAGALKPSIRIWVPHPTSPQSLCSGVDSQLPTPCPPSCRTAG